MQVQEASTAKKTEIDAIEDVLLDDFSFGDEDSEGHSQENSDVERS